MPTYTSFVDPEVNEEDEGDDDEYHGATLQANDHYTNIKLTHQQL